MKIVESKISEAAQAEAREVIRAVAGVGLSWNFWFKVGTARYYLGSIRGSKEFAIQEAKKLWPEYRANMTIRENRNLHSRTDG
jgi:hypothetical protein